MNAPHAGLPPYPPAVESTHGGIFPGIIRVWFHLDELADLVGDDGSAIINRCDDHGEDLETDGSELCAYLVVLRPGATFRVRPAPAVAP